MIPGLDGLRAIAFFLIFLFHANFLDVGWVGVVLFFVLSGFLITGILVDLKESLPAKAYLIKFYGRRFLRIFPLYYFYLFLMLAVTLGLYFAGYRRNRMFEYFEQIPYALAYVYNFFTASNLYRGPSYFISHLWSLSVEEQFYIFWPILILLTPKTAYKKLFLASIVLGPLFRMGLSYLYNHHTFTFLGANPAAGIYALPFSHIDAFGFGAFVSKYRIPKARQQFWILLTALPILGYVTQYLSTGNFGTLSGVGFPYPIANGYKQIWGYSLLNYFFAIAIYAVAREGLFNRFLELSWVKYLGKISYGLYVYHFSLFFFFMRLQDFIPLTAGQAQWLPPLLTLAFTILLASLSYKYIEKPSLELKDRFFAFSPKKSKAEALAGRSLRPAGLKPRMLHRDGSKPNSIWPPRRSILRAKS
jgi:peptidoglycan/LPS O-acetylase OafA/YrhL